MLRSLMLLVVYCCSLLSIACTHAPRSASPSREAVAVPDEMQAPHQHVEWTASPELQSTLANVAPLPCQGRFNLRLRFEGLSHLVSARTSSAAEIWVLFPKTDISGNKVPRDFPTEKHVPALFFPPTSVRVGGALTPRQPNRCPDPLAAGCAGLTFSGGELSVSSGAVGAGVGMDWRPASISALSLRHVVDFDELTERSLPGKGRHDFSRHVVPRGAEAELAGRFRGTVGRLRTAQMWKAPVHVRKPGSTAPALRRIAHAFELVVPVNGCAELVVQELADESERGTIRVASLDGSDVTLVIDHAPIESGPCRYHFHNHYRLRNLGSGLHRDQLIGLEVPGQNFCGNAQCSPGCSEWP